MTSDGGSKNLEGGTLISQSGTTFLGRHYAFRVYYDQGVIIWVLEMICAAPANPFKTAPSAARRAPFFNRPGASASEAPPR